MRQRDEGHGFVIEECGSFSADGSQLILNYGTYSIPLPYSISSKVLTISFGGPVTSYTQDSSSSNVAGWASLLEPLSQKVFPPLYLWSLGVCDSAAFVLEYGPPGYLLRYDFETGGYQTFVASKSRAIDAFGSHLWTVADTTVTKRRLPGFAPVESFRFRELVSGVNLTNYHATGLAVNDQSCYIMMVNTTDNPAPEGILLRFTSAGAFVSATTTHSVIKDLCLVGTRLFCSFGMSDFFELDPTTGRAKQYYRVRFGDLGRELAIAWDGVHLVVGDSPTDRFRVATVNLPASN